MQAITKYISPDGVEHSTPKQCQEHELLMAACDDAMSILGNRPELSHGTYIEHDRERCLQAKRNMLAIIRKHFDVSRYPVFNNPDDAIHPSSFVGRLVDDGGPAPMRRAWGRLMCIDFTTGREYDQPYFANHPHEAQPAA